MRGRGAAGARVGGLNIESRKEVAKLHLNRIHALFLLS